MFFLVLVIFPLYVPHFSYFVIFSCFSGFQTFLCFFRVFVFFPRFSASSAFYSFSLIFEFFRVLGSAFSEFVSFFRDPASTVKTSSVSETKKTTV
jgi:hypothetical protein